MPERHKNLLHSLGDINFQEYLTIERDAQQLNRRVAARRRNRKKGRSKKSELALTDASQAAVDLVEKCCRSHVPPPPALIRLLRLILRSESSRTTGYRRQQFLAAAQAESESCSFKYKVPISEVARRAGVDRKTVRDWRGQDDYVKASEKAMAARVTERVGRIKE